jgi:hypothetical protein
MPVANQLERRLRLSGVLLILGLVVEVICLSWARPMAFIVMVGLGGLLLFGGIVVYLYSLVTVRHEG